MANILTSTIKYYFLCLVNFYYLSFASILNLALLYKIVPLQWAYYICVFLDFLINKKKICKCLANCININNERIANTLKNLESRINGLEAEFNSAFLIPSSKFSCRAEDFQEEVKLVLESAALNFIGTRQLFQLKKWGLVMEVSSHRIENEITVGVVLKKMEEGDGATTELNEHKCLPLIKISRNFTEEIYYRFGQQLGSFMSPSPSWKINDPYMQDLEFDVTVSHFKILSTNGVADWQVRDFKRHVDHFGPVFKTSEEGYLVKVDLVNHHFTELRCKVTFLLGLDDEKLPKNFPHNVHVILSNPHDSDKRFVCQPHSHNLEDGSSQEFRVLATHEMDALSLFSRLDGSFTVNVYILPIEN